MESVARADETVSLLHLWYNEGVQQCNVAALSKGIASACLSCTRRLICLAEVRAERRAAKRNSGEFLSGLKARLAANEARAAAEKPAEHP